MPQSDIDKILEEIKLRRQQTQTVPTATAVIEPENKPADETPRQNIPAPQKQSRISEKDKATLSRFINNTEQPEKKQAEPVQPQPKQQSFVSEELDAQFADTEYVSKKSEDYIDENFMKFFTQSVIVTKSPEETSELQVKRKKGGFFKRKYITDSLSLNIETLEEEEEKRKKKARRKDEITKDMPIVKTAGDVYARTLEMDVPKEEPQPAVAVKTVEKADDTSTKTVFKRETKKRADSLSAMLGDDKDPDSLAKRILEQRKKSQQASTAEISAEKAEISIKEETKEITKEIPAVKVKEESTKEITKPAPEDKKENAVSENNIINNIYTAVIEAQAKDALASEQMTGYIPEFDDEEEAEESTTPQQTVVIPPEAGEESEEVFEEYIVQSEFFDGSYEESVDITEELFEFRQTLSMRMLLGFVCGGILSYLNMAAAASWPVPAFISPAAQPMLFYIACAVIYAIAFVGFLPTVLSGFASVKNAPAPDSLISLGAVMAMVQLLVLVIFSGKVNVSEVTVFGAFVCLAMSFNAMGKKIATTTIIKNLTLANVPDGINAGYIINDNDAVKRLARTLDEKVPKILVSRKTGAITNFVKAGFSIHNSDYTARKLAVVSWLVTAVCFVMGLVLSKNLATAVFCAAGASALQIPLSQTLVNSVPSALMQKSLEKVGALVNGWQGIDQLSKTTHVNFDAKHLFPTGTVILHGIKTFEKERIDLAIIYAASVLIEKCDVMRPVFMDVIEGKTDILYPVDSCEYIERQGYVSWINNNRVIVGNRTLMEKYDVNMPPISLEAKFTKQGRKPVYLAVGGKLFGMFVISYRADSIVKENLDKLMDKGVSIILSSTDFNIDEHLIEEIYDIPSDFVSVLNQKEAALLAQFTEYAPESEACMAHLDSLPSLVAGFCSAESAKSAENICSMIQIASVVIGAVLALMFTWSQTIMHLPLLSLLLLSFGFMGLTMLAAFAKKY